MRWNRFHDIIPVPGMEQAMVPNGSGFGTDRECLRLEPGLPASLLAPGVLLLSAGTRCDGPVAHRRALAFRRDAALSTPRLPLKTTWEVKQKGGAAC